MRSSPDSSGASRPGTTRLITLGRRRRALSLAISTTFVIASCAGHDDPMWSAPHTVGTAGRTAGSPTVIDVNQDSHLDIVFPCAGSDDGGGQLAVFLGNGSGGFTRHPSKSPVPFPGRALKVALGDINKDGRVDAAVGHHDSHDVAVLLGDGAGRFEDHQQLRATVHDGADGHTHSVVLADVNRDSDLDLITTCSDDNAIAVSLGDGSGKFERARGSPFEAGRHPYEGLSVGLLNDDAIPDIAVPNLWGDAASILLGDGTGSFNSAAGSPVALGSRPGFLTLGNLNGDQDLDMVVTHDDNAIVDLLLGDGNGGMSAASGSPVHLEHPVWGAVITDLDGDGNNDVLLGGSVDQLFVLFGDGRGGLRAPPSSITTRQQGSGYVAVGDFNDDGRVDLVVAYYSGDGVDVCFGR